MIVIIIMIQSIKQYYSLLVLNSTNTVRMLPSTNLNSTPTEEQVFVSANVKNSFENLLFDQNLNISVDLFSFPPRTKIMQLCTSSRCQRTFTPSATGSVPFNKMDLRYYNVYKEQTI